MEGVPAAKVGVTEATLGAGETGAGAAKPKGAVATRNDTCQR